MRPLDVSWAEPDSWALHAVGLCSAFLASQLLAPIAIRKLRGARIVGHDRHKPNRPEVAEMGGVIVFGGFMASVLMMMMFARQAADDDLVLLASLLVACGAAMTGILDDMIELRQRFKALMPVAFAIPLALFIDHSTVSFPLVDTVEFGWTYTLVLVPAGVTCAANGFNMLEGFNGLGTGLAAIIALALAVLVVQQGDIGALLILVPLLGALLSFLLYNWFPASVFPGDTLTLLAGAMLGTAAIVGKVEFWGALLFLPHIVEFFLKARGSFKVQSFAASIDDGILRHVGPVRSLTHMAMGAKGTTERILVLRLLAVEALWAAGVVVLALVVTTDGGP